MKLDPWQKEVLDYDGNCAIRSSRQAGKSTIIAIKAAMFALKHPESTVLIVAAVERQALLLFEKTLNFLLDNFSTEIKQGKEKPTKHQINLENGAKIYSVPCGLCGTGIRGYTVDLLIIEECAYVPEPVFQAIMPMLAVSKGKIVALSTPFGRGGFFYDCFNDPAFKTWHIKWTECPRIDKEFIEHERKRMSKVAFAQEYEAEFVDELKQFFPTELIQKCMVLQREQGKSLYHESSPLHPFSLFGSQDYFCGVDVARLGEDETVLLSVLRINRERIKMIDMEVTRKTLLTETIHRVKKANQKYNYKRIYIDTTGIGSGVFDPMLQDKELKRKVVAIENAKRSLDREDKNSKRLMKEDLYNNVLVLMEQNRLELFDDPEIMLSLKSVQYEYGDDGKFHIWASNGHIIEALVRACWCMRDKSNALWVR